LIETGEHEWAWRILMTVSAAKRLQTIAIDVPGA
jgi:hypothetical protein